MRNKTVTYESVPRLTLLAMSPMSQIEEENGGTQCFDTTTFNAESYVYFFKETFDTYGLKFHEWCLALIGDNVSSNKTVSAITGKPHIGFARTN